MVPFISYHEKRANSAARGQEPPPTIITLTLPTPSEGGIPLERATATLLIQHGDVAHVRQFTYIVMEDLTTAIKEACIALAAVEAEPTAIPLRKDTLAVRISHSFTSTMCMS